MAIDVGKAVGYLDLDITGFKRKLNTAASDFKIFNDQTATSQQKLQGLSSGLTGVGGTITKYVSAPLSLVGGLALKFATDFETGMAKVSTIADTSVISIKGLSDGVLDISNKVHISSTELSEALYQTISATGDTANALGYVEQAAKLAKGGFTTVTKAVDGATSVLNAYGLSGVENFQKVSDVMVQTQNIGKTTVDELANSLYNVIPTASSLGISFEQVGASLAAITAQGTPTAVATTQLRQLFVELSKEGTKTSDTFRQMSGQSFRDFIASGGDVAGALEIMETAAKRNNVSLSDMFGSVEAGNAALQLTGEGADKFNTALKGMENSSGSTQEAFEKMMGTAGEAFAGTKISFQNMLIEITDSLLPALTLAANALTRLFNAISALPDPIQAVIGVIGGLLVLAGPLLLIAGQIAGALANLEGAGIGVAAAFSKISGEVVLFGQYITDVFAALAPIVLTPFAIIGGLFVALGVAIKESGMTWAQFKQDCADDMEEIKETFSTGFEFIVGVIDTVREKITTITTNIVTSVTTMFSTLWNNIVSGFKSWKDNLVEGFDDFKESLGDTFKEWVGKFKEWGQNIPKNIWLGVKEMASELKTNFQNMLNDIFGGSTTEIQGMLKGAAGGAIPATETSATSSRTPKGVNTRQMEEHLAKLVQLTEDAPYRNQQLART